jgi:Arc/MetJ-type ribon-helix-helix transcriptional regulator
MPTISVALTGREDRLIDDLVASGAYRSADDVFHEGLSLIGERLKEGNLPLPEEDS